MTAMRLLAVVLFALSAFFIFYTVRLSPSPARLLIHGLAARARTSVQSSSRYWPWCSGGPACAAGCAWADRKGRPPNGRLKLAAPSC